MERFFVLTGGPGAGKTSLIAALAAQGVAHRAEAGRAVIRAQLARGGTALPWADRAAFADRMLARDRAAYRSARAIDGPVLFDRGIPDIIGYRRLCGLPIPAALTRAAQQCRYNPLVFIAPPWRAIYAQDAERKQDWAEAVATHDIMLGVYRALGYHPIALPLAPVAARARFVLDRIGATHCI